MVADLMKPSSANIAQELFPSEGYHIVAHKGGFEEADIKAAFEGAGLNNVAFVTAGKAKKHGHPPGPKTSLKRHELLGKLYYIYTIT